MMKSNHKISAFSLLELSVVMVVVGIISVGIVQGVSIINSTRLASARSITLESRINEIDGLVTWYETTLTDSLKKTEITDGAQITAWQDISPGAVSEQKNRLTKTAGSNLVLKTRGINSLPSLQFSSSGNLTLSSFYQGTSSQCTVFIVLRPITVPSSTQMILLDSHSTGSSSAIGIRNNAVYVDAGSATTTAAVTNAASFSVANDYILNVVFNGSSSQAYVNNATTMAGNAVISPGTNQLKGLTIGTSKASGNAFGGMISEIIIYDRVLKLHERKSVMSYLSKKYKILVSGL